MAQGHLIVPKSILLDGQKIRSEQAICVSTGMILAYVSLVNR